MFDEIGAMADNARDQRGALRQFHFLEHPPLVLVAGVRCFDRETSRIHPENQVDDVPQRDVIVMRAVVTAPADMQADFFPRDLPQGVIEGINPYRGVFAVFRQGDVG